jgi:hypothetical protein
VVTIVELDTLSRNMKHFFSISIKLYSTSKSVLRTIAMSLKGIPYFDLIILGNI